jgi:hypothetical protein
MNINELISGFEIYTTNEEREVLDRLTRPVKLTALNERERVIVENMIRKSLVIKIGHTDPSVVKNEY